jgi:HicB family
MRISLLVEELRSDVISVGELGDDTVAETAERIAEVLARSLSARVLDLLTNAAAELSDELAAGRVEVRVAGDDIRLAYVEEGRIAPADDKDASARISLRLSESLKARVEQGAAREGVSVNTYIVRTLDWGASNSSNRSVRMGNRLHGYGTT